jgi:hypothetical protein
MAAIYSNGGNRWNILGFNFTKRDALSSVYKISMLVTFHSEHVFYDNANQRPLGPTHGRDEMKVTERIRAVCSCFCKRAPCEFCHLSCFFCQIKKTNAGSRLTGSRFAGKQCTQSRLVISYCLTAPPHTQVTTKTHSCCFANIRESKSNSRRETCALAHTQFRSNGTWYVYISRLRILI